MRASACLNHRLPVGSCRAMDSSSSEEQQTPLGAGSFLAQPTLAARRCVVEHQGAARIVHQPDGSIICEPLGFSQTGALARSGMLLSNSNNNRAASVAASGAVEDEDDARRALGACRFAELRGRLLAGAAEVARITVTLGAIMGVMVAGFDVMEGNFKVEPGKVVRRVNDVVSCFVVGALAGAVAVPTVTVLSVLRLAVRPVLLGAAVHGVVSWAARHRMGAVAILKKLQSGDLSRQLEALRRLVARLEASAPFCSQFKKLAGVEVLLRLLSEWLDAAERGSAGLLGGPRAVLLTRALADLSKQGDAVDSMVELGGVPVLLRAVSYGLSTCALPTAANVHAPGGASLSSSLVLAPGGGGRVGALAGSASPTHAAAGMGQVGGEGPSCAGLLLHATAALARVASGHAVAQQLLASEPTAASLVVSVLEASTARNLRGATVEACDALRGHAVSLAQALSLEPVGKAALGQAGGVEALAAALLLSSPWTQGQEGAAAALHTLVRGDVDNQRRLAALAPAGLSAALHRALAASPASATNGGGSNNGGASPAPGAAAGAAGVAGTQAGGGAGATGGVRPASPLESHWHKADLLALSNVIARFSQLPQQQQQQRGSTASPPNGAVQTPPVDAAAASTTATAPPPPPARPVTTLAQRLGLRRAAPPKPAAAPAPTPADARASLDEPALAAAAAAVAAAASIPMPGAIATHIAGTPASTFPETTPDAAPSTGAGATAVADVVATLTTPTAAATAGGAGKGLAALPPPPGSPESDDWEQDCGVAAEQEQAEAPAAALA